VRPRLHHSAFHDGQYKLRECLQICALGETIARILKAFFDSGRPTIEVVGQALVHPELLLGDFQGEAADGAAVSASGGQQVSAVEFEDAEHAADGVGDLAQNRGYDDGLKRLDVEVQDGQKERFFGLEKVIEAAGFGLAAFQDLSDTGCRIPLKPKEI